MFDFSWLGLSMFLFAGQLQFSPEESASNVFGGRESSLPATFRNNQSEPIRLEICYRLFQKSSSITMPVGQKKWKLVEIPAQQTIVTETQIFIPKVRSATSMALQYSTRDGKILGATELMAYPEDFLTELHSAFSSDAIGIFEPEPKLSPTFLRLKIPFQAIHDRHEVSQFKGKLLILGPFHSTTRVPFGLREEIIKRVRDGMSVMWIEVPQKMDVVPSSILYKENLGKLLVVRHAFSHFDLRASDQLLFLHLARSVMAAEPLESLLK
jgi:hypothetical protein